MAKKVPSPIDKHVGSRMRMRRLARLAAANGHFRTGSRPDVIDEMKW